MSHVARAIRAFARFWWDFLVGDTPEFAVATLAVIGLAYLMRDSHLVAAIALPLVTATFLLASTYRGRLKKEPEQAQDQRD
ncbi:MAG TPA: hypothetical protein VNG12_10630 [Acidimicrobiales bacterium]|nr:hypothetical protein [Acidimicrobiales bacterium]